MDRIRGKMAVALVTAALAACASGGAPGAGSDGTSPPPAASWVPAVATPRGTSASELREVVERYRVDRSTLERRYPIEWSPDHRARLDEFLAAWQTRLADVDFAALGQDGRIDWLLLRTRIDSERRELRRRASVLDETAALLPFAKAIFDLHDARMRLDPVDPESAAATLAKAGELIEKTRKAVEAGLRENPPDSAIKTTKLTAHRAAEIADQLDGALRGWFQHDKGYDPLFDWWIPAPYEKASEALKAYRTLLREKVVGEGPDATVVGDPIGREALQVDLGFEWIPYGPDELVAIAEREFAWCEGEMKKASREMGLGDDWKAALEKVKSDHAAPGRQPELVLSLAREATAFLEEHDLVTVPALAKDDWRLEMMSPERQKVAPFFLGGETIHVSFPTDSMEHDQKMMSLRGNNVHFSRATVFHEMIPGHHLQQFMNERYCAYRGVFSTPFWTEGWALYWEMLFWDLGWAKSPENRVGMLFWRMHRCARILFSLGFHTGRMTPDQCIDLLVDKVGHERANAAAEVRRSFDGSYGPLYQVAYMIGGLQFRALHRELVDSGRLTNRAFHDAILQAGNMPVEMVRALLEKTPLARDTKPSWRFAGF
jgi:uncharacterized protein (DUF885 family)